MDVILIPLINIVYIVLYLYMWVIIVEVIISWMISLDIINTKNPISARINNFLYRITEPCLQPIRRVLPNIGGLDFSPIVLVLILYFMQMVLERLVLHIR